MEAGGKNDPLEDYRGISLCRRSFRSLPRPPAAGDDLLSTHNFLISLPLKDEEMFAEKAKVILEGGDGGDGGARARRPGLGIKRARAEFRLRVLESGGNEVNDVAEPAELDIDKLKDPEELFSAFEKLENVKRELAKQKGRVLPDQQHSTTWDPRPRRPGLPGRSKTREYKHLFPTALQDSSQENVAVAIETGLRQESVENEPEEKEDDVEEVGQAAAAAAENQVNKILDDLLACDDEDLDGDGAMNLLRDRFQIKPTVIEMFELPKMPEVRWIDSNTSHGERRKRRTTISDVHNLLREPRIDFKKKKSRGSLANSLSPTPPRSPKPSLSLPGRSIMQSDPISDPFSIAEPGKSPKKNDSPAKDIGEGSDAVHADEEFRDSTVSKSPPYQSMGDDMPSLPSVRDVDGFVDPNDGNLRDDRDDGAAKEKSSSADIETETDVQKEDTQIEALICSQTNAKFVDHTTISSPSHTHIGPALADDQPEVGYTETHDAAAAESNGPDLDQLQEPAPAQHNVEKPESSTKSIENPTKAKPRPRKERKKREVSERRSLAGKPEASTKSIEKPTKAKPRPQKERQKREISGRRSLAGSGTSWQTGIRRSTRIKSRPLEFWKGEKFLYGRVHESLATVIGIKKFDSPANDKRTMKVKSFVSEEFKDFVDLAALG